MKVCDAVAQALAHETSTVFGLMGDGNIPVWGALDQTGKLKIIAARHEAGAVAMADGYYRATGEVGVATITWGPGVTQVGTSLMAAARNRTPLVLVVPEHARGQRNKLQVMNQRRFFEACETRCVALTGSDSVADDVAEAFYAARVHRGPVVLCIPGELMEQPFEWDLDYRPSRQFVPALDDEPDAQGVEALVAELMQAERPVIIAGRGARLSGAAQDIMKLGDQLGALLATSLQAKGLFEGEEYNLGIAGAFSSRPAEELFAEADYVLGFGAELGYYTAEGGMLFPSARVARVDISQAPPEIGVLPGRYVRGDARKTAGALVRQLEKAGPARTGYRSAETRRVMDAVFPAKPVPADGLDPRRLMTVLSGALPAGAQVTCGAGHFFAFVGMYLAMPEGAEIQFSSQFGAVGQTLPVAIGICTGRPGRKHLVIEGDGSLLFNIQELETVTRLGLQLTLLVMNDGGYGAEVHKLSAQGFDPDLARWTPPDYVSIARAFGGDGVLLKSESDLPAALQKGFAANGLFLIDARLSPTTLSDPYEKLNLGRENQAPLLRRPGGAA